MGYIPSSNKNNYIADDNYPGLRLQFGASLKGGIITLVVYSGHKGGLEENAVEKFLSTLDKNLRLQNIII